MVLRVKPIQTNSDKVLKVKSSLEFFPIANFCFEKLKRLKEVQLKSPTRNPFINSLSKHKTRK